MPNGGCKVDYKRITDSIKVKILKQMVLKYIRIVMWNTLFYEFFVQLQKNSVTQIDVSNAPHKHVNIEEL